MQELAKAVCAQATPPIDTNGYLQTDIVASDDTDPMSARLTMSVPVSGEHILPHEVTLNDNVFRVDQAR